MNHTTQFLLDAAARPANALPLTETSEDVCAELNARGVAIGVFFKLLPYIVPLVRTWTGDGDIQDKIAATIEILAPLFQSQ